MTRRSAPPSVFGDDILTGDACALDDLTRCRPWIDGATK